jgi:hypothetical protein
MNSEKLQIGAFLEEIDQWKFRVHEELKGMTLAQRAAFWNQIHEDARKRGLTVVEPEKAAKRPTTRARRAG